MWCDMPTLSRGWSLGGKGWVGCVRRGVVPARVNAPTCASAPIILRRLEARSGELYASELHRSSISLRRTDDREHAKNGQTVLAASRMVPLVKRRDCSARRLNATTFCSRNLLFRQPYTGCALANEHASSTLTKADNEYAERCYGPSNRKSHVCTTLKPAPSIPCRARRTARARSNLSFTRPPCV